MSRIESRINSRAPEFRDNTAHMQGLVDDILVPAGLDKGYAGRFGSGIHGHFLG